VAAAVRSGGTAPGSEAAASRDAEVGASWVGLVIVHKDAAGHEAQRWSHEHSSDLAEIGA